MNPLLLLWPFRMTNAAQRPKRINFDQILLSLWKIFNINMPYKHVRLNDPLSRPLISNDDRFIFLTRIVYWLGYWQSLPEKDPLEHHFGLYRTSALRELLFTLYLYSGLQPSVWGESYL